MSDKPRAEPSQADRDTVKSLVGHPSEFRAEIIAAYRVEIEAQAKREGAREALEQAARVAARVVGGFTANVRVDESEQQLVPDSDGPWVLNSDVAKAIRALLPPAPEVGG